MKRSRPSKLSDAALKALLKGLHEEVAAPAEFRARVLDRLRRDGLLSGGPLNVPAPGAPWWKRFVSGPWAAPWGLGLASAAALALVFAVHPRFSGPVAVVPAVPGAGVSAAAPVSSPSSSSRVAAGDDTAALADSSRLKDERRPIPPSLARPSGSPAPVLAYQDRVEKSVESSSQFEAPVQGRGVVGIAAAAGASAPLAQGPSQAIANPGSGAFSGSSGGGPLASARGAAVPAGGGKIPTATPTTVASPTPPASGVTPAPVLAQNSQVRNNVVLASRGQSAQILFKVAQAGQVLVVIYNRMGQKVAVLQDGVLAAGQYNLPWSGSADFGGLAASGIYEVIISTPTYGDRHKIMLVK